MSVVQRKAILKTEGFFPHKNNAKGTSIIYSRKHPTAKFVRVVIDSGINNKTNKIEKSLSVKLCYVNRQKQWREITTETVTDNKGLIKAIKAHEAAEKFVKKCQHCKAKKFKAKSGKEVCANVCWTKWSANKKSASPKKKSSQKTAAQKTKAARQKNLQGKVTPKSQRTYPLNKKRQKSSQKKLQKFEAQILPGDLVTIQEIVAQKIIHDYTGSVLGIVQEVKDHGYVKVHWTANTTFLEDYLLPNANCYYAARHSPVVDYRFKVLSRNVEYEKVI